METDFYAGIDLLLLLLSLLLAVVYVLDADVVVCIRMGFRGY